MSQNYLRNFYFAESVDLHSHVAVNNWDLAVSDNYGLSDFDHIRVNI